MLEWAKRVAKKTPLRDLVVWLRRTPEERKQLREGKAHRRMQAEKYATIREYAAAVGASTLVETGTFQGDAIFACRDSFDRVYSIELDPDLHRQAVERFKDDSRIELLQGDSKYVLPRVLELVDGPAVFWLDGHYSGGITARGEDDSPIVFELDELLVRRSTRDAILIDDARCFVGSGGYPTLDGVREMVLAARPDAKYEMRDDIIRVLL